MTPNASNQAGGQSAGKSEELTEPHPKQCGKLRFGEDSTKLDAKVLSGTVINKTVCFI